MTRYLCIPFKSVKIDNPEWIKKRIFDIENRKLEKGDYIFLQLVNGLKWRSLEKKWKEFIYKGMSHSQKLNRTLLFQDFKRKLARYKACQVYRHRETLLLALSLIEYLYYTFSNEQQLISDDVIKYMKYVRENEENNTKKYKMELDELTKKWNSNR